VGYDIMKVCLVNPIINAKYNMEPQSHLGIAYIAATLLNAGYSVDIIDAPIENKNHDDIFKELLTGCYDAIGISCYYFNYNSCFKIIKFISINLDKPFLFIGGYLPTLAYQKMKNDLKYVDCFVVGEGELTTLTLLENYNKGKWRETLGIAYLNDDRITFTGRAKLVNNLDSLPFPIRKRQNIKPELVDIAASRGCYGNCSFCGIREFYETCEGSRIRRRSPQNVVAEIEYLTNEYGTKVIDFVDDNFFINSKSGQKWFYEFSSLIKDKNIRVNFQCNFRANEVVENPGLIKDFIEIGLKRVFIGVESFLDKHLKFYNKLVSAKQNIEALEILDDLKINYDIGYLLYNPITTIEDIIETVHVLENIGFNTKNKHIIRPFSAAVVNSPYGTQLNDYILENNLESTSSKGYYIKEPKARLCYEVAYKWKSKTDHFYLNRYLFDIAENMNDCEKMQECKNIFYDLFYYDSAFLKAIAITINNDEKHSIEEFDDFVELWYSGLAEITERFNRLKEALLQS
jgi:radical SAM superfamily enzyme YgiQ (UPF0313 family)